MPHASRRTRDALEALFARTGGTFRFGLERMERLLAALGDPHLALPVLHVAGTNGKGSTVATAEALLRARGMRVARYTSPHLVEFNERIVVDGTPIPGEAVGGFLDRWMPTIEALGATFFEATTAMAFDWIARSGADAAVIETGLGGRLDATNVVRPLAAGVTSIGYDHMEYLGGTLEEIAAEKAGIFKAGVPAVIGEAEPQLAGLLAARARAQGASPVVLAAKAWAVSDVVVDAEGTAFTLAHDGRTQRLRTALVGEHQARNAAVAMALLDAAGGPFAEAARAPAAGLAGVALPGRFDRRGRFLFDVAHNADGVAVLVRSLRAVLPARPLVAVVCILRDKEWPSMLRRLGEVVDHFVFTDAPTAPASRAWSLAEVAGFANAAGLQHETVADFDLALERAGHRGATVLVTGSFHTVGDAMARLPLASLVE
ncbi:MAG TPA: folylpolyglutamate synthase/dihydrofolate synthase family protein [Gemmatimonadaceae bacterium]